MRPANASPFQAHVCNAMLKAYIDVDESAETSSSILSKIVSGANACGKRASNSCLPQNDELIRTSIAPAEDNKIFKLEPLNDRVDVVRIEIVVLVCLGLAKSQVSGTKDSGLREIQMHLVGLVG